MGKTIMISSLLHTSPPETHKETPAQTAAKSRQLKLNSAFRPQQKTQNKPPSSTLIVAPTSLLAQWGEELERSSKAGVINVLVWHGQGRVDLEAFVDDDEEGDDG